MSGNSTFYAGIGASRLVKRIAHRMEPITPAPIPKKAPTGGNPRLSDDEVKQIIRRYLRGGSNFQMLASGTGLDEGTIRAWCLGENRRRLLIQVEKELKHDKIR